MSCQHNAGQTQHKTISYIIKKYDNIYIFWNSDKSNVHSQSNVRADDIQGTHANSQQPTHLSYLPTLVHKETIFPAAEYGMRNLVCHNMGRWFWKYINTEENISTAEHTTKRIEKIMSRGPS
jgi:hypothetical protein